MARSSHHCFIFPSILVLLDEHDAYKSISRNAVPVSPLHMTPEPNTNESMSSHRSLPLTGIRGYGFLLVFLGHYFSTAITVNRSNSWVNVLFYVQQIGWLAVPAFFVLSGYLIGGNLFRTRNQKGFFKVFYFHRILRVFPPYYLTLLVITCVDLSRGIHLDYKFWSHFLYLQNYMPGYTDWNQPPNNQLNHLWSLAIEEQFYLTWPLVVWLARDRRTLLKITIVLCALCWTVRLISPLIHLSTMRCYFATPTRVDTILFGVVLALIADTHTFKRLQPYAKYAALCGTAIWMISFSFHSNDANNYYRLAVEYTIGNFTLLALISAVMEEGSVIARVCSVRWACWLGNMSYGLYVFHYTYHVWFLNSLRPRLSQLIPQPFDLFATGAIALVCTVALGMISYRFIEQPALTLKKRFKYGRQREMASETEPSLGTLHPVNLLRRPPAQDGLARSLDLVETRDSRGVRR